MKKTILVVVLVIVIVAALIGVGYWIITRDLSNTVDQSSATKTATSTQQAYVNSQYKFSIDIPVTWENYDSQMSGTNQLFEISYRDPAREREIKVNECVFNEDIDWANPTPVEAECVSYMAELSQADKEKILNSTTGFIHSKSIIIQVFEDTDDEDLQTWITKRYRLPETELQDFELGKQITMGGETGYFSNIGCCADYIVTYTVKHGDKVYSIGTNYEAGDTGSGVTEDNTLLQEFARTFKFIE